LMSLSSLAICASTAGVRVFDCKEVENFFPLGMWNIA
jgi:hypothetical protein